MEWRNWSASLVNCKTKRIVKYLITLLETKYIITGQTLTFSLSLHHLPATYCQLWPNLIIDRAIRLVTQY